MGESAPDGREGFRIGVQPCFGLWDDPCEPNDELIAALLHDDSAILEGIPKRETPLRVGVPGGDVIWSGHGISVAHFPAVGKWMHTEHDHSGGRARDRDVLGHDCHGHILVRTQVPASRHARSSGSFPGVKAAVDAADLTAMLAAGESGGE
ncbi:MAG: hypothetical protein FGM37_03260 [Phycisphaerales bacterium]|nr:hypothetical protein [Phycisphaerales bacterium]